MNPSTRELRRRFTERLAEQSEGRKAILDRTVGETTRDYRFPEDERDPKTVSNIMTFLSHVDPKVQRNEEAGQRNDLSTGTIPAGRSWRETLLTENLS